MPPDAALYDPKEIAMNNPESSARGEVDAVTACEARRIYAAKPCADCPWRRDVPAGQFPPERYEALRATAGRRGSEAELGAPIFACHKSAEGKDIACAGWLAVVGAEHLSIRMAVISGRIPGEALSPRPDWPPLFDSYEEMAETQGGAL